jgi:hypothetical protein
MKKLMFGLMILVTMSFLGNAVVAQKKSSKARDLFIEKEKDETQGQSGVKFRILLKRSGDRERFVSPDETFYAGDKIKLAFDINFSGYVGLLSVGSSGKVSLLYPYSGVDARVEPSDDEQFFPGEEKAWITFDDKPGTEKITVVFSTNVIKEIDDFVDTMKKGTSVSIKANAQEILVKLNSRSLNRSSKSRDLFIEKAKDDATYVVADTKLISQPTAFVISLRHDYVGVD